MESSIRSIFVFLMLLGATPSQAQMRAFFGRIVNKDNKGIPNSFVKVEKANQTYLCDSKGEFYFKADIAADDSFSFYGQGFDKTTIELDVLPEDSIIVELQKKSNRLQEAVVGAHGGHKREAIAGAGRTGHDAGCYLTFKDEIALFLPVDSLRNGLLNEVNVFITKNGEAVTNKFIVHIYERDSTGAPGEEVTDSTLVLSARKGNEWVSADLTNKKIQVKGGLFVSVEWVVGYKNDGYPWLINGASNYYAGNDSLRTFYNGQVLGLTWLHDVKPVVYRRYARTTFENTAPDKWFLTPPLVGGRKRNECITPMMYFTYTYVEH